MAKVPKLQIQPTKTGRISSKSPNYSNPVQGMTATRECESCHQVKLCTYDTDPFAHEIRGDETLVWQCKECAHESAMDV